MKPPDIARTNILGVGVSAISPAVALAIIDQWIKTETPNYVCLMTAHSIMESHDEPVLQQVYNNAGLAAPDGMPLVWLSRLFGQRHVNRVYGPDLMLELCRSSIANNYRHFFYGSTECVLAHLVSGLSQRVPGLIVAGAYSPPFRPLTKAEDEEVVALINATAPDIVWIGLSAPKQDLWAAEHVGRLTAPVLIGVGAAFDFHAGTKRQAPLWMQRCGLEWLFRLATEPRRLWKRYLYNNPRFIWHILLQLSRLRRYSMQH